MSTGALIIGLILFFAYGWWQKQNRCPMRGEGHLWREHLGRLYCGKCNESSEYVMHTRRRR